MNLDPDSMSGQPTTATPGTTSPSSGATLPGTPSNPPPANPPPGSTASENTSGSTPPPNPPTNNPPTPPNVSSPPSAPPTTPVTSPPAEPSGSGGAPALGSGGTPVTGGSAGTSPGGAPPSGGGAGPVPPGLGCTGSELLCEDFEAVAVGAVPGGAWHPLDASCAFQTASFTMGVSAENAHGGSQALKVTNKHFPQCRLSGQFEAVDEFWVRAYMFWGAELDISNRETLDMDLTPGFRTADDPAVRFGYRSKAPCEAVAGPQITIIGVAGGEATGCGARPMPQGEWFCFEAHVLQTSLLDVSTFINGEAITYQSTGKPQTTSVATEVPITEKIDHVRLGIFSTGEAVGNIFIDDVAVATTRLGCGT